MDKDLYKIMQEIFEAKKTEFSKDIKFAGTITSEEMTNTRSSRSYKRCFCFNR